MRNILRFIIGFWFFCLLAIPVSGYAAVPIGAFDGFTEGGTAFGWAFSADFPENALVIHFYADAPAGPGRFVVGWTEANVSRPDLNAVGIPGNHGFIFEIPAGLRDGKPHALYAYAIDPGGGVNPLLEWSPRQFSFLVETSLSIVSPVEGALVNGLIHIDVEGTGPTGTVELYADGMLKGAYLEHPYRFGLDTKQLVNGTHRIEVRGYDLSEKMVAGSSVIVVVQNDEVQNLHAVVVGGQDIVRYAADKCEWWDIPDTFTRAFRDARGVVNLWATSITGYRMIGDSLDTVGPNCSPIMASEENVSFDVLAYHEWLTSPYTLDGQTIYSLVHNEWYAWLVDPRCTQNNQIDGWVNSITLAVSTDGGVSFIHPSDYIVRQPPVPWDASFSCAPEHPTIYGSFTPSNIISGADGYYYAMFQSEADPTGILMWGSCLMRNRDVSNASSWEVFTKDGWAVSKIGACTPLERDKIEKMHGSLTFNLFLNAYVLVDEKFFPERGVFFSLSEDLMHWTEPVMIFAGDGFWYPTLLDPSDTSRNFEETGRMPYVYFIRPHHNSDGSVDVFRRDLVRQQVQLQE